MMREGRIITQSVAADMANPRFENADCRILIVRLSPYRDIESSYSHLVLFDESRRAVPGAYIDFAFFPPSQDCRVLTALGKTWFYGRASGKNPSDFDIILISCAFTLELINLPWLLSLSGIPSSRGERLRDSSYPLLFLGGSSAVTAGALVKQKNGSVSDSLVDAIFFGEGEGRLGAIVRIACDGLRRQMSKAAILDKIALKVQGFWPCDSRYTTRRAMSNERPDILTSPLVLNGENAGHTKIAITAGCSGHCSFCLEGWDRRPFREKSLGQLSDATLALKRATGASDLELFSYNFNIHHEIMNILPSMGRYFFQVSLMSQRLDILAKNPVLLEAEFAAGKRSFTLGVEGISERLRRYYHKGLSDEQIGAAVNSILKHGAREMKLFFIISGFENEEDLSELRAFCEETIQRRDESRSPTRIIVSAGYLVRLPFTPLQFAPLAHDRTTLARIAARVETICADNGLEFRLAADYEDYWADQLLSSAGPLAYEWLSACPERKFIYDQRISKGIIESLEEHLVRQPEYQALLEEKPASYLPCFSFVEDESHWKLLRAHYEHSALQLYPSPKASNLQKTRSVPEVRASAQSVSAQPYRVNAQRALSLIRAQETAKPRFPHIDIRVREHEALAFSTEEYECSWLIRTLATLVPTSERALFKCVQLLPDERWATAFPKAGASHFGISGEKYFALYGPDAATLTSIVTHASQVLKKHAQNAADPQNSRSAQGARNRCDGSAFFLESIEQVMVLRETGACTLLYTLNSIKSDTLSAIIQSWLEDQGVRFTLKNAENSREFHISTASLSKKSISSAKYYTSSSNIVFRFSIGRKADLQSFADLLQKEFPGEDICFRIESWN